MIIKNGKVFQEDGSYKVANLYVENGRIVASADALTAKTELEGSARTGRYPQPWCSQT